MGLQLTGICLTILAIVGFVMGTRKSQILARNDRLHSRPRYHGMFVALWILLPGLVVIALFAMFSAQTIHTLVLHDLSGTGTPSDPMVQSIQLNKIILVAEGRTPFKDELGIPMASVDTMRHLNRIADFLVTLLTLGMGVLGWWHSWKKINVAFRARQAVERIVGILLIAASSISLFITLGIILSLIFETLRFFSSIPVTEFIFGLKWSPQTAIRADQVGGTGSFGAIPLFAGTLMITGISILVAAPVGLFCAIYLSEFASPRVRRWVKPALEILAGVPTVVYGLFAALSVAPAIASLGSDLGLEVASESALAAGLVMGIMIIPFVSSLSDDVINAVPQAIRDGSLAMGATEAETIRQVVLPAALPGIVGALLLAISRAVGETMIVVMAAGLAANLTANPLQAMTTVTVQIVTLLVGDQEFDSPKTLAAFALGLTLFFVTLILNVIALGVVKRYHEKQ
ncbi:MAG: phosphate ABC transporter permease subunit PstC [Magnetococcales bacterium]|nr:phosphate ABC transporter permease subunit PstC [Magnetococcales bacterium]MBF0151950.1 phosphate ABC transporter permease subunit PstC [Magnetococcales bacterium]